MLYFLVREDNDLTIRRYAKHWADPALRRSMQWLAYERLPATERLPDATYIFCDLERLDADTRARAQALWERLAARGSRVRLLNRPGRTLGRYALLRTLYERGVNRFNVYRPDEPRGNLRFPVFVRSETEHHGAYTGLLNSEAEVNRALDELYANGHRGEPLLIVEFLDTRCDAYYRKWAATRVGDRIIAHHMMARREWVVKAPSLTDPEIAAEDRRYRESNPHADRLREIFDWAGVEYGRVDYGILGDAIQVWEINTNPMLLKSRRHYTGEQLAIREAFARKLNRLFVAIDDRGPLWRRLWRRVRE